MEAKVGSAAKCDPVFQWQHEQEYDDLMVHVPEFKTEHLRVLVNNCGILKISGDRPAESSFYKEVILPPNCNPDEIQAKYVDGILHIIMPKKISDPPQDNKPNSSNPSIAVNVAAIVAVISVITACSYYMYNSIMGSTP
nr:inactive protein RESTRICTED TEV MOVEMENT 2-like [Ipomoea batatas]